jgi:hypothetical protein
VSGSPTVVIVVVRIVVISQYETTAFHRFLIPGDPALTIGCVKGGEAVTWDVDDALTQPIGKSDTSE